MPVPSRPRPGCPLEQLLARLGGVLTPVRQTPGLLLRPVTGVMLWLDGDPAPKDPDVLVLLPDPVLDPGWRPPAALLDPRHPPLLVVRAAAGPAAGLAAGLDDGLAAGTDDPGAVLLRLDPSVEPAGFLADAVQALRAPEETGSRRLAALQRSLTQALADPDPVAALTRRLSRACNAAAAVVRADGTLVQATGPLPLALLHAELRRTDADTQQLDVSSWRGVAVRVTDPATGGRHGWVLVAARRDGFPDPYATAATQVAAALVETSLRVEQLTRGQDRAVRAALLEQAVTLPAVRDDPELAGRVASLGVGFDAECRVLVAAGEPGRVDERVNGRVDGRADQPADDLADRLDLALTRAGVPHLTGSRNGAAVALLVGGTALVRRVLADLGPGAPAVLGGIGRPAGGIGAVADSFHDAVLAVRLLRRRGAEPGSTLAYEDFDVAVRLFADVGLERMVAWAEQFLAPLHGRDALLEALAVYFEHEQNVNRAAEVLGIHHNSLRYRLAKAEEALRLNLRDPASVSSVFLALTARDLHGPATPVHRPSRSRAGGREAPGDAPSTATGGPGPAAPPTGPGVIRDPGH